MSQDTFQIFLICSATQRRLDGRHFALCQRDSWYILQLRASHPSIKRSHPNASWSLIRTASGGSVASLGFRHYWAPIEWRQLSHEPCCCYETTVAMPVNFDSIFSGHPCSGTSSTLASQHGQLKTDLKWHLAIFWPCAKNPRYVLLPIFACYSWIQKKLDRELAGRWIATGFLINKTLFSNIFWQVIC